MIVDNDNVTNIIDNDTPLQNVKANVRVAPHNCAATTGCKETPENYFTVSKSVFALNGVQARIYGRRRKLLLSNSVESRIRNRRWGNGDRVVRALGRHDCGWGFESRSFRNFVKFLPSYVLWMGSPALVRGCSAAMELSPLSI